MTALLIIAVLTAAIFLYLLLAPFSIEIDSRMSKYMVRFNFLAKARLQPTQTSLLLDFQIAGWHKRIDLFVKQSKLLVKKPKTKKKNSNVPIKKIVAMFNTFKLSVCHISVDTGDMALNGILYPGFLWLSRLIRKDIGINFHNKNTIIIKIENNLYRLLRAYITH